MNALDAKKLVQDYKLKTLERYLNYINKEALKGNSSIAVREHLSFSDITKLEELGYLVCKMHLDEGLYYYTVSW